MNLTVIKNILICLGLIFLFCTIANVGKLHWLWIFGLVSSGIGIGCIINMQEEEERK